MSKAGRLAKLEQSAGRAITGDPEHYCLKCLGPGGYRLMIDRARAAATALGWPGYGPVPDGPEPEGEPVLICRGCGGDTMYGATIRERQRWGIE